MDDGELREILGVPQLTHPAARLGQYAAHVG